MRHQGRHPSAVMSNVDNQAQCTPKSAGENTKTNMAFTIEYAKVVHNIHLCVCFHMECI